MINSDYTMIIDTNQAEVHALLSTFLRCWGEGRRSTLHLETEGGRVFPTCSFALGPLEPPGQEHPAGELPAEALGRARHQERAVHRGRCLYLKLVPYELHLFTSHLDTSIAVGAEQVRYICEVCWVLGAGCWVLGARC